MLVDTRILTSDGDVVAAHHLVQHNLVESTLHQMDPCSRQRVLETTISTMYKLQIFMHCHK